MKKIFVVVSNWYDHDEPREGIVCSASTKQIATKIAEEAKAIIDSTLPRSDRQKMLKKLISASGCPSRPADDDISFDVEEADLFEE